MTEQAKIIKRFENDPVFAARVRALNEDDRIGDIVDEASAAFELQRRNDRTGFNTAVKSLLASAMPKLEPAFGPLLRHRLHANIRYEDEDVPPGESAHLISKRPPSDLSRVYSCCSTTSLLW